MIFIGIVRKICLKYLYEFESYRGGYLQIENEYDNPTGYENEGLPSGRNLEGQSTLGRPVHSTSLERSKPPLLT